MLVIVIPPEMNQPFRLNFTLWSVTNLNLLRFAAKSQAIFLDVLGSELANSIGTDVDYFSLRFQLPSGPMLSLSDPSHH